LDSGARFPFGSLLGIPGRLPGENGRIHTHAGHELQFGKSGLADVHREDRENEWKLLVADLESADLDNAEMEDDGFEEAEFGLVERQQGRFELFQKQQKYDAKSIPDIQALVE
jgi:hypothetical protein